MPVGRTVVGGRAVGVTLVVVDAREALTADPFPEKFDDVSFKDLGF
jgi:hypothetical protein